VILEGSDQEIMESVPLPSEIPNENQLLPGQRGLIVIGEISE